MTVACLIKVPYVSVRQKKCKVFEKVLDKSEL